MKLSILILNIVELFTFLIGLLYLKKLKQPYLIVFVYLLGFIFMSEMIGKYLKSIKEVGLNRNWYHLVAIPIQFITLYWLYAKQRMNRWLFIIPTAVLIMIIVLGQLFFTHVDYFSSISYSVGTLMLLIIVIQYFYRLLSGQGILKFRSDPFFWIGVGLLIFYLPTLPFEFFRNYLRKIPMDFYIAYFYFSTILNCMMYVCFCMSFLWKSNN